MGPDRKGKTAVQGERGSASRPYNLTNKIDMKKAKECYYLLEDLLNHNYGSYFKEPVEPIKQKLRRDWYSSGGGLGQFVSHVRSVFSNAMRSNPVESHVPAMANELNNLFNARWVYLEDKWAQEDQYKQHYSSNNAGERYDSRADSARSSSSARKEISAAPHINVFRAPISVTNSISRPYESSRSDASSSLSSSSSFSVTEGKGDIPSEKISSDRERRVAILKSRFAGTIARAEQQILFSHVPTVQFEREEERIESSIEASEPVLTPEQILQLRQESRIAFDELKCTVEFNDLISAEVEKFVRYTAQSTITLSQFGLVPKDKKFNESELLVVSTGYDDNEEGEIV